MKRAMTESAKAEKAKLILDTAYKMFQTGTFEEIKMNDVAKAANISNGTLFYYYGTKEILFMEMLFREYEERFRRFTELLLAYEKMNREDFKAFFLGEMDMLLDPNSVLVRLSAIKNTVLEKNIDEQTAQKDSVMLYTSLTRIVSQISERTEFLSETDCFDLLLAQNAILVGFANMADLPDVMLKAIEEHNLQAFQIDFKARSLAAMELYITGLYERLKKS
ncbi:TetR family transcriptional regulator [Paenibacillus physcomitrellae]|uniref:HTH tetR-type domain-containing protein n=1 Tax=Paenibacillus physcomitrellae TaxID=1619311 RepID=A0ABQ1FNY6_9BACL|nr:TetR family transcriptional regulator [Paenibacillus physcomitrellae]GGA24534.1 hypothetical protein GCM10010917_06750 [Paenibacillus physcomitrellae]